MEDNNTPEAPSPCTAGCGFYGNKIYNNMCSKCFKEKDNNSSKSNNNSINNDHHASLKNAAITSTTTTTTITTSITASNNTNNHINNHVNINNHKLNSHDKPPVISNQLIEEVAVDSVKNECIEQDKPLKLIQTNKSRCFSCRSKIPLAKQLTNKCRCDYIFCDTHRFPDKHDCTFDHASKDKDILAKNNPKLNDKPRGGNSFNRLDS